jgi:hypothetical protein
MAEQPGKEKSLEMRVAELEDKLAKLNITEEEMKAFQKVSSLLGGGAAGAGAGFTEAGAAVPMPQTAPSSIISCIIRTCIIRTCIIRTCIINCINECTCGPCIAGGGGVGGAGFGGLGM